MGSKKILIAEDEAIVGLEMREFLESRGYDVVGVVPSADDILGSVLVNKPDLIVMDVRLKSFIDGIDAVERVRLMSKVPVIYVTAFPSDAVRERAMKTSPVAYLVKPIDEDEFARAVESALSSI